MTEPAATLPSFERPPVVEVLFGAQFESIVGLRAAHLGLLWERLNQDGRDYSVLEEYVPLDPVIEHFGPQPPRPPFQVEILDNPPVPRVFISNSGRTSIWQVQANRAMYSWVRANPAVKYPRYPAISATFNELFREFCEFLDVRGLQQPRIRQAELAYINVLPAGEGWTSPAQIERVIQMWQQREDGRHLPEVEDIRFLQRHLVRDEEGVYARLYVGMEPTEGPDDKGGLRLSLTVRGRPRGEGLSGLGSFMDNAHEVIVRTFAAVTTEQMHERWGRVT
jgi:uncharacterized protein (TIGR04255 family)